MTKLALVFLALMCGGCASSLARPSAAPPSPRCQALDDARIVWSGVAKGAFALTAADGLAALPAEDHDLRLGLAAGAVGLAAVGAVAQTVAEGKAESWTRECTP